MPEYKITTQSGRVLELEKEWHKPSLIWGFENESARLKKDKLLYG